MEDNNEVFFAMRYTLKTYAAISNAHLSRVCKRGKLSGPCLSTLNGFGSTQLPIFSVGRCVEIWAPVGIFG